MLGAHRRISLQQIGLKHQFSNCIGVLDWEDKLGAKTVVISKSALGATRPIFLA